MIPIFDLKRQNKILKKDLMRVLGKIIDRGYFVLGENVERLETSFAKYLGVKYAIGLASGTDALSLALFALGVAQGDEVIIPANSYPTAFAVAAVGALPKLVDIDLSTFNIDPQKIPNAITKKTKVIIPVHLYGQPADMGAISEIGRKYGIPVIEDCCQAHGAEYEFKTPSPKRKILKVGSIGDMGCFSFYPTKNLACFGDAGMVMTNNREIYQRLKLLRMYGEKKRYRSVLLGRNSRMDEIQAGLLLLKLGYLERWNRRRKEIARKYRKLILGYKLPVLVPNEAEYAKHVYHLFVVRTRYRDRLKEFLGERGIQTGIHYPVCIHLVKSFRFLGYKRGDFPNAERASAEVLSLPMFPELKDVEVRFVVSALRDFLASLDK